MEEMGSWDSGQVENKIIISENTEATTKKDKIVIIQFYNRFYMYSSQFDKVW